MPVTDAGRAMLLEATSSPGELRDVLTAFLLGRGDPPPPRIVRGANLGAWAYAALPADHPDRAHHHAEFLAAVARHLQFRQAIRPLLAAWHDAGIEALLFKGFHLAEFVYPVQGTRFHTDADVVIHPGQLRRAAEIAASLGWTGNPDLSGPPLPFRHSAYDVFHPAGSAKVDVQRYVIHAVAPWTRRQRRLTDAVMARAIRREWEGTTVLLPHPVDAALVCLLVHRAWGSEAWGLKPHDLLDLRYLVDREGVTREALEARAKELGCRRTLALMLDRCDPWRGRFIPGVPTRSEAWRLDLLTLAEHIPVRVERMIVSLSALLDVARALPLVLGARRAARRERDLHRLLEWASAEPARRAPLSAGSRRRLTRGIRWAAILVPSRGISPCVVRSLALYRALRRHGLDVSFVSGERREGDRIVTHAWVEEAGRVLPELGEPTNRRLYEVNFEYPPSEPAASR